MDEHIFVEQLKKIAVEKKLSYDELIRQIFLLSQVIHSSERVILLSDEVRRKVGAAAQAAGLTVDQWAERILSEYLARQSSESVEGTSSGKSKINSSRAYSEADEDDVKKRLEELGYLG